MKAILLSAGLSSLLLGASFYILFLFCRSMTQVIVIEEEQQRKFSTYVDNSGYYDTVVFTHEDSILAVY